MLLCAAMPMWAVLKFGRLMTPSSVAPVCVAIAVLCVLALKGVGLCIRSLLIMWCILLKECMTLSVCLSSLGACILLTISIMWPRSMMVMRPWSVSLPLWPTALTTDSLSWPLP